MTRRTTMTRPLVAVGALAAALLAGGCDQASSTVDSLTSIQQQASELLASAQAAKKSVEGLAPAMQEDLLPAIESARTASDEATKALGAAQELTDDSRAALTDAQAKLTAALAQLDRLSANVPEPAKTAVTALKTHVQDLLDQVGAALKEG